MSVTPHPPRYHWGWPHTASGRNPNPYDGTGFLSLVYSHRMPNDSLRATAFLEMNPNCLVRSVVVIWGRFCLPGEGQQCLETSGVITVGGLGVGFVPDMLQVEVREVAEQPVMHRTGPHNDALRPKPSVVLRLRNTSLDHGPAEVELIPKPFTSVKKKP